MCCLFGMFTYGESLGQKDMKSVISALGTAAMERGRDATGIAFLHNGKIEIQKAPKPAYAFKFKLPAKVKAITGHTRLATQGSEKNNQNNHPFFGKSGNKSFALAHNGIIHNDKELRRKYDLPKTEIETDSYIALQLLEKQKLLTMDVVKEMAETVEGSFCFTILDNANSLYLVKGNNPLSIIHNKQLKTYFYASTEQILWSGLINSSLFGKFKSHLYKNYGAVEEIPLNKGQILQITKDGSLKYTGFMLEEDSYFMNYRRYGRYSHADAWDIESDIDIDGLDEDRLEYIRQLKDIASYLGLDSDVVDVLIDEDFTFEEIEEYLYDEAYYGSSHSDGAYNECVWA